MHAAVTTTAAAAASQNSRRRDSITKFRQAVAPGESPPGGRDAAETRDAFLAATPQSHNATPQLSRPLRPSPPLVAENSLRKSTFTAYCVAAGRLAEARAGQLNETPREHVEGFSTEDVGSCR